jgi:broad specificity phosphatase PhoE
MTIFAIRHLKTPLNKLNLLQGSLDIEEVILEYSDLLEISKIKKKLSLHDFSKIYTSELKRTQITAEIYGFHQYEKCNFLNELSFGSFEGEEKNVFLKQVGEKWFSNPKETILSEEIFLLESNVISFLKSIKENDVVLIFAHGAFMRALVALIKTGKLENMNNLTIKNNELIELKFSRKEIGNLIEVEDV